MDFDERIITCKHVLEAVRKYRNGLFDHHPARSAFLIDKDGKRFPAKFILRLAFQAATGEWVAAEQLTGGRASVRVLRALGFEAVYDKPQKSANRSAVKSVRREALRKILEERWGTVIVEHRFESIRVPDLELREMMDPRLRKALEAIEDTRKISVQGQKNRKLACDYYLPDIGLVIEYDERQHFTPLRAAALRAYSSRISLGFDRKRWITLSEEIRAGDNSPMFRDEQRAFYDAVRDILASEAGLGPIVRIFEEDIAWERKGDLSREGKDLLERISKIAAAHASKG